jgi:hypothetical protein
MPESSTSGHLPSARQVPSAALLPPAAPPRACSGRRPAPVGRASTRHAPVGAQLPLAPCFRPLPIGLSKSSAASTTCRCAAAGGKNDGGEVDWTREGRGGAGRFAAAGGKERRDAAMPAGSTVKSTSTMRTKYVSPLCHRLDRGTTHTDENGRFASRFCVEPVKMPLHIRAR